MAVIPEARDEHHARASWGVGAGGCQLEGGQELQQRRILHGTPPVRGEGGGCLAMAWMARGDDLAGLGRVALPEPGSPLSLVVPLLCPGSHPEDNG